jgi:hypothetical protein
MFSQKFVVLPVCPDHSAATRYRHHFKEVREAEPAALTEVLVLLAMLYRHEQAIRDNNLYAEKRLACRTTHSEPITPACKNSW